jgi:5-methylcytosine-specific restriction enzyme A
MTWTNRRTPASPMPRDWERRRRAVLDRDGWLCTIRGPRCIGTATSVDHIVPRSRGGTHDDSNLRSSCQKCHDSKTASEANAARTPRKRTPERHPGFIY